MATNVEILGPSKGLVYVSPERVHVFQKNVHSQFDDVNAPAAAVAEIHCHWRATVAEPDGYHKRFWVLPNDVIVINRKLVELGL